jgi:hypothetical protein
MEFQGIPVMKIRSEVQRLPLPDFKMHYKAIVIKAVWYQYNGRHMNQWNKINSQEINPYINDQFILNKDSMIFQ